MITDDTTFVVEVLRSGDLHYWKRTKHEFNNKEDAEFVASYLRCLKRETTRVVIVNHTEQLA